MKIIFLIAVIFLCINVSRFIISAVVILFTKSEYPWWMKIWNVIETAAILWALIVLLVQYYK